MIATFFFSGYGDSTSTLVGQVSSEDVPYVCTADLPDNPRVRSEFLFPPLIGQLCHTKTLFFLHLSSVFFKDNKDKLMEIHGISSH